MKYDPLITPTERKILDEDHARNLRLLDCVRRDPGFSLTHPIITARHLRAVNQPPPGATT